MIPNPTASDNIHWSRAFKDMHASAPCIEENLTRFDEEDIQLKQEQ